MSLIENLKEGCIPSEIKKIALNEKIDINILLEKILSGRIVVPKNKIRSDIFCAGIGEGLSTKINANIGTSERSSDIDKELKKLSVLVKAKADAVMDLSTGGDLDTTRQEIIKHSPIPVGTVPIYQAAARAKEKHGSFEKMTKEDIFESIERHAADGADFMTIHAGVTLSTLEKLERDGRIIGIVSRGGAILANWMIQNDKENPLYQEFDRLLEITSEYDITLSLGDGLRPGCIADATDKAQIQELIILGELVKRAREASVQVMVEGPGHIPVNQIYENIKMAKELCDGAPFYVLGPIVTDVAPGYDHITAAIGGALAASYGADFLCYVTPSEHLGLPSVDDVREGVIASKIAAHAADVAKGVSGASDWDLKMAKARSVLDWEKQIELSVDPEKSKKIFKRNNLIEDGPCSMCGDYCSIKMMDCIKT
ncbi:MAG: phosphomethylpyrimidine synthase ThiC [Actinobacteria bacterium]|nr:phosphomethylpyrimidine synthase ThiC [Actinomycetota bacterium]